MLKEKNARLHNVLYGQCPACEMAVSFHFLGTQKWPLRVVVKRGVPQEQRLWVCDSCKSTITEESIIQPDQIITD